MNQNAQYATHTIHHPEGISLITLIITIIVIIILASVVIFTGLNTPEKASFAKYVLEIEDIQTKVSNTIENERSNNIINGTVKSDEQLAYMVATGSTSVPQTLTPTGMVSSLGMSLKPSDLKGTKYFEITDNSIWPASQTYMGSEKHYLTDKGEVFMLPGYLVAEDDTEQWYINQNHYYTGTAIEPGA